MPLPTWRRQEGAWPGCSTNHSQVTPAPSGVTCLQGSMLPPNTQAAGLLLYTRERTAKPHMLGTQNSVT